MLPPNRPRREPTENNYNKFAKYFTLIMSLIYPALGLFLFFSSPNQVAMDPTMKKILGVVLVVYGVVRFLRTYQRYFKTRNRFDNED